MKRTLSNVTHVTRGYGRNRKYNRQKSIRFQKENENYRVEIRKFDRNFDTFYFIDNMTTENLDGAVWRNLKCLIYNLPKGDIEEYDGTIPSIEMEYECSETGNYMLDLLYFSMNYDVDDCNANISVSTNGGDFVPIDTDNLSNSSRWAGDDNNINRHSHVFNFVQGNKYNIKYDLHINTAIIGAVMKKFDVYYGTRTNDGDLTIDDINIKINDKIQPNEATVKIWYNHDLDDDSNLSGYLFDYRDEINIYKHEETDTGFVQIFGGYITTVDVESDNTVMTINCADRLIDGENRFCLQEMVLLGGETDEKGQNYSKDSYHDYDSRADMLDYLTNIFELPLNNNNILNNEIFQKNFGYKYWYGNNDSPIVSAYNMLATNKDGYLIVRNGSQIDTNDNSYDNEGNNPQSMTILDTSTTGDTICLNDNPNFYLSYGLGEKEWTKTIIHTTVDTTTTLNGKTQSTAHVNISNKVCQFADSVTKSTGEEAVKALWKAIAKFPHEYTKGFSKTPEQVIKNKKGNCCSKSRLLAQCLSYKGIKDIYYVHIKKGNATGHVFLKLKKYKKKSNFYIDPSYSQEKNGWGNYGHYNGASVSKNLKKETLFPDQPL